MPDLPKLLALADALGISLDELCGREKSAATTSPQSPPPTPKKRGLHILLSCVAVVFLLSMGALILSLCAPSAPSPSALAGDFTVSGLNFSGVSNSQIHYRFVPSISSEELSYQIVFVGYRGKTFPIDAPCVSGVCSGEAKLSNAYAGYSVSVSVTDGKITRSIPVAHNLTFSQGNASWTPIDS